MKSRLLFPALVLATIALAAQTAPDVEITAEPHHHLLLENQQVRVWLAEVAPHDATLMHRHNHDYVFVSLGDTNVQNEVEGKPPVTLKMQDGETHFSPGGFSHIARDLANTPFRAIAVELMQDEAAHKTPPPKWDEDRGLHVFTGGTQDIMFVQDGVRVSETELQPGATLPSHHHTGPHLAIAVSDDWQRRGVGRALLLGLRERAMRAGVRRFTALTLGGNLGARALAGRCGPVEVTAAHDGLLELSISLR